MSSAAASPSGGKSRIDTMSHEDLQQFAKKQMTMLKNLKNKTDIVTKERDSMKTELSKTKEEHEERFQKFLIKKSTRKNPDILFDEIKSQFIL